MKKTLSLVFSLIVLSASVFTYSANAKANKVAICHNIGNGEFIVIVVSENAAAAHYSQHGDLQLNANGTCGDDPLPPPPQIE